MPLIKPWVDPNTGASFGQACYVVSEIETDSRQHKATIFMNVYVGLTEYSGGKQPLTPSPMPYDVTGAPYMSGVENPLRQRAQNYIAGLAEYSGAQVVP